MINSFAFTIVYDCAWIGPVGWMVGMPHLLKAASFGLDFLGFARLFRVYLFVVPWFSC